MPRLPILTRQVGLPATTGAPRLPDTSGLLPGAVSRGLGRLEQVAERRRQLQQATDLLAAQSDLQAEADRLQGDLALDTDYRTMEDRVPSAFDRFAQDRLKRIADPEVRLAAERSAQALRRETWQAANARAVKLQVDDAQAQALTKLDRLEKVAAGLDGAPLQAVADEATRTVQAMVVGGAWDADEGVRQALRWRDGVLSTKASQLVNAVGTGATSYQDALAAVSAPGTLFSEADPEKREGWIKSIFAAEEARQRRLDRAEQDLEDARQRRSQELRDQFHDQALQGTLRASALEAVGPNGTRELFGEDYRSIRDLIQRQFEAGGVDTPSVVQSVRRDLILGRLAQPQDILAHVGRGLTLKTANDLMAQWTATRDANHPTKDPEWGYYRGLLVQQVTGRAGLEAMLEAKLTDDERARLDLALDQYWERTVTKGQRGRDAYKALLEDVVGPAAAKLPPREQPRYASPIDAQTAFDRGLIGQAELDREKRLWKAIQDRAANPPAAPSATPKPGLFGGGGRK